VYAKTAHTIDFVKLAIMLPAILAVMDIISITQLHHQIITVRDVYQQFKAVFIAMRRISV